MLHQITEVSREDKISQDIGQLYVLRFGPKSNFINNKTIFQN